MYKAIVAAILTKTEGGKKFVTSVYRMVGEYITTGVAGIRWKTKNPLTVDQHEKLKEKLEKDYYIILTRRAGFFSTHLISFLHLVMTGKWGYYGHVFMNLEDEVDDDKDYRFIEAITTGVRLAGWAQVFDKDVGSVALLKPASMTLDHWTAVLDKAKTNLGKPYDTLFDLADEERLSCVELVRLALRDEPNYAVNFANFEEMISKSKNLDPQMFLECPDFQIIYEIRN